MAISFTYVLDDPIGFLETYSVLDLSSIVEDLAAMH